MALKLQTYVLATALENIQAKAKHTRDLAVSIKAQAEAGNISADTILNLLRGMKVAYDVMESAKVTPGLNDYAKTEFNDPLLDYVAEVTAAQAAMVTCFNWITTNLPKDASGYLLKDKIVNGVIEVRTFTPAQTAGLSTVLGTLIAAFA